MTSGCTAGLKQKPPLFPPVPSLPSRLLARWSIRYPLWPSWFTCDVAVSAAEGLPPALPMNSTVRPVKVRLSNNWSRFPPVAPAPYVIESSSGRIGPRRLPETYQDLQLPDAVCPCVASERPVSVHPVVGRRLGVVSDSQIASVDAVIPPVVSEESLPGIVIVNLDHSARLLPAGRRANGGLVVARPGLRTGASQDCRTQAVPRQSATSYRLDRMQ